jgi:hypothetical protein
MISRPPFEPVQDVKSGDRSVEASDSRDDCGVCLECDRIDISAGLTRKIHAICVVGKEEEGKKADCFAIFLPALQ